MEQVKTTTTATTTYENVTDNYIEATASQLVTKGVKINGKHLDAVGISMLARYGIIEVVGHEQKQEKKRGKAGAIFRIHKNLITD